LLALLRAAKEEPGDVARRQVLADWLEEHGDEHDGARAEFIRLQCERAGLPAEDPRQRALLDREEDLWARHRRAWLGPVDNWSTSLLPSRGLWSLTALGRSFAGKGALAGTEAYAWVEGLRLKSLTAITLKKIAPAGLLGGLTALSLQGCPLRDAGVRALALADLSLLTDLDLRHCWIGNAGAATLAQTAPRRLTRLDLRQNMIHATGIRRLAAWPALAPVVDLSLRVNRLEGPGAEALAESPHLGSLKVLDLGNCFLGDRGVVALTSSPNVAHLTDLDLFYCQIGAEGANALVDSPHLAGLQRLELVGNERIPEASRAALRERFGERVRL
jgi:uncharacterized protein (TIGR02996 family)